MNHIIVMSIAKNKISLGNDEVIVKLLLAHSTPIMTLVDARRCNFKSYGVSFSKTFSRILMSIRIIKLKSKRSEFRGSSKNFLMRTSIKYSINKYLLF